MSLPDRGRALALLAAAILAGPLLSLSGDAQVPEGGRAPSRFVSLRVMADADRLVQGKPFRLALVAEVAPGWHVNSHAPKEDWLIPTDAAVAPAPGLLLGPVEHPAGQERRLAFSEKPLSLYQGTIVFRVSGTVDAAAAPGPRVVKATLEFQPCDDQQCQAPASVEAVLRMDVGPAGSPALAANAAFFEPPATATAGAQPTPANGAPTAPPATSDPFGGKSLPLLLGIVFLSGLALNLTPCVYPLIPITVSYFGRQAEGRGGRTFGLAVAYVLGMSVTYSALGVFAALSGTLFGAWLQRPLVLVAIATVVLALALSMFGLYELQAPHFITDRTGSRSGPAGAFTMGLFVGFVAAPCIGPFVLSLLTYVAARGSASLGFGLFFTLAMGLGLPYLILGTATSGLSKLPRSGEWMVAVRKVFGFVLVALAVYFLRPLLPGKAFGWLMAAPLATGAAWFAFFEKSGARLSWFRGLKVAIAIGLAAAAAVLAWPHSDSGQAAFAPYSERAIAEAKASGRPVLIDFAAAWCLPCKELEEKTFPDRRVREALSTWILLRGDLTRSTPENEALKARWSVRGVPTIVFLGRDGNERGERLLGFEPPEALLERLKK